MIFGDVRLVGSYFELYNGDANQFVADKRFVFALSAWGWCAKKVEPPCEK